ncbi:MAG: ABC transporter substrate-binding protein [Alphaproteobacteria bacterium]|nr:ABC transporter substrate-binding protein [Alphaproteobacteria bacterium]
MFTILKSIPCSRRQAWRLCLFTGAMLLTVGATAALQTSDAKNRFVLANNSKFETLDPHMTYDRARVGYRINLYDSLLRWVDNPPKLIPWLAKSHSMSADGKSYNFVLNEGMKFHDGTEILADDIVYSIERQLALKKGAAALFSVLIKPGTTKKIGKYEVQFNLSAPSSVFLSQIPSLLIVNADLLKKHEKDGDWGSAWLSKNDAGSGSFKVKRYDPAIGFIAERFKDHFVKWGDKYLDEVEFRTVLETNSRVLGLMKGNFHGTDGYLSEDQLNRLRKNDKVKFVEEESMRLFYFTMHNKRPPFDDVNFRKAVSYSFDYDGFVNNILKGTVVRNPSPIPNNLWGSPKDVKGYTYDLEKAKEYLAKSKGPKREIVIGALAGFGQTEQAAVLLQNGLSKIGVKSKVVVEPWPVVKGKSLKEKTAFDLLPLWKSAFYIDPHNWIGELYGSAYIGTRNYSYYGRPDIDTLLKDAETTADQEKRAVKYQEAARKVVDDAGGIFVYNQKWSAPYSTKVGGIRFTPPYGGFDLRWMYIK